MSLLFMKSAFLRALVDLVHLHPEHSMKISLIALAACCAFAGSALALDNPPSTPPNLVALDNPPSTPPNVA
jgi:hypothetical protein